MKYTNETIQFMNLFETITRAKLKDCFFVEDRLVFIAMPGEMSKAIGKQGANVKKMQDIIKKQIKIVEFNDDPVLFIRNYIYPIQVNDIKLENGIVNIYSTSRQDKGIIIGRDSKNLNNLKEILKRYFSEVQDIKVI